MLDGEASEYDGLTKRLEVKLLHLGEGTHGVGRFAGGDNGQDPVNAR